MIHIVFNESEIDLMKQVIKLDETLAGEIITYSRIFTRQCQ